MLKKRVLTAVILIPLVLAAIFGLAPRAWALVTLAVIVVAAHEWAGLAGLRPTAARWFVAATLAVGIALLFGDSAAFSAQHARPGAILLVVCGAAAVFWLLVAPLWLYFGWRLKSGLALALLGELILIATWIAVVHIQGRSPGLLLAMMAIVWIADTAAYFAGRRFGRHKLAPRLSPGKTWEGVYGALGAVGIYALALLWFAHDFGYSGSVTPGVVAAWLALVFLLAGVSVVGDLFESQLKRQRGIKDSGHVLPGHGGILDRIDALTAVMPAAALIADYMIR